MQFDDELLLSLLLDDKLLDDNSNEVIDACERTKAHGATPAVGTQINKHATTGVFPLSSSQQRIWLTQTIENDASYHIPRHFILDKSVDLRAIDPALQCLIAHHPSLRTRFYLNENTANPEQEVLAFDQISFKLETDHTNAEALTDFCSQWFNTLFTLNKPPLIRACLLKVTSQDNNLSDCHKVQPHTQQHLLICIHHIVSDARSSEILSDDFLHNYWHFAAQLKNGVTVDDLTAPKQPPIDLQYSDYALWQNDWFNSEQYQNQKDYWQSKFKGMVGSGHDLSNIDSQVLIKDRSSTLIQKSDAIKREFFLESSLKNAVEQKARRLKISENSLLLAAYHRLLFRVSGNRLTSVGYALTNRESDQLNEIVGCFINTQVSFAEFTDSHENLDLFIGDIHQQQIGALNNASFPYEHLLALFNNVTAQQVGSLFNAFFNFKQADKNTKGVGNLGFNDQIIAGLSAKFDVSLEITRNQETFYGVFECAAKHYKPETVEYLTALYQECVMELCNVNHASSSSYATKNKALLSSNQHCFFEEYLNNGLSKSKNNKQSLFTYYNDNNECEVYFDQLFLCARKLADKLNELIDVDTRLQKQPLIAISLPRSISLLVSYLAVRFIGAGYVAIDPDLPEERITYILNQSKPIVFLTDVHTNLSDKVFSPENSATISDDDTANTSAFKQLICYDPTVYISSLLTHKLPINDAPLQRSLDRKIGFSTLNNNIAYILFTSGSTGKPKGVQIGNRALDNFLAAFQDILKLNKTHSFLALTTISFDISGLEIWLPLCTGANLVLAKKEHQRDPEALFELILQKNITHLQATPTTWAMLMTLEVEFPPGFVGICGGEALSDSLAAKICARGIQLLHVYGPTETTIWSTAKWINRADKTDLGEYSFGANNINNYRDNHCDGNSTGNTTLGRPIANTDIYILDEHNRLLDKTRVGELCIGGAGLAEGYYNRDDLTQASFIHWKDVNGYSRRIYKTGDLARINACDELEFFGRKDNQVKIRGHRIELGEIESEMSSYEYIKHSCALVIDEQIIVCAVLNNGESNMSSPDQVVDQDSIKAVLAQHLPYYMVPNQIMFYNEFPLNSSGKTDRNALTLMVKQSLQENQFNRNTHSKANDQSLNQTQQWVVETLSQVLNKTVSLQDDFFANGGNSLLAVQSTIALNKRLNQNQQTELCLPMTALFEYPTAKELADFIDHKSDQQLRHVIQRRLLNVVDKPVTKLVCFHPAGGGVEAYANLASFLSNASIQVYGIESRQKIALNNHTKNQISTDTLLDQYCEQVLASVNDNDPINLLGWCLGGHLALAVADRLVAHHKRVVAWVGVIDYDAANLINLEGAEDNHQHNTDYLQSSTELWKDFLDFKNFYNVAIPETDIRRIKDEYEEYLKTERIDNKTSLYQQGLGFLLKKSKQLGLLDKIVALVLDDNQSLPNEELLELLELRFMTEKSINMTAKRLVVKPKNHCVDVWLCENRVRNNEQIISDWQNFSNKVDLNVKRIEDDHFGIVSNDKFKQQLLKSLGF
ncbi:hypothetical protein MAH1_06770 [Sessilibacter sp. MAH1]